jgi:Tfp pilus assembly protein PilE
MIPIAAVGMLAAVSIPAFIDYQKKSKRPEAALQLNKLAKNLKVAYMTNGAFPKGKVPLTPAKPCCNSGGKCNDVSAWQNPVWQTLDFSIDDPHFFRYSYESNGKTVTGTAVGDLDCDGIEVTWLLNGSVDAQGNPTLTITEPPPNTD